MTQLSFDTMIWKYPKVDKFALLNKPEKVINYKLIIMN